jgi:hypothetical protein
MVLVSVSPNSPLNLSAIFKTFMTEVDRNLTHWYSRRQPKWSSSGRVFHR